MNKMYGNTNVTKNKNDRLRVKRYTWHEIIRKLSPFEKVNFKVTPIERQSL